MSKIIKFSVEGESYKGLIYEEEDLHDHIRIRLEHNVKTNTQSLFNYSNLDDSHILLSRKHENYLYDLIIFINNDFNIKEFKNTYMFKNHQILEILFSQL